MKRYTFTIEIEEAKSNKDYINSLIDKVAEDKKQLEITYKINEKTTQIHREMFEELINGLNKDLEKIGVSFRDIMFEGNIKHYKKSKAIITFKNHCSYILFFGQLLPNKVEGLKYSTFAGDPKLTIERSAYKSYIARDGRGGTIIKTSEDVLKYMERDIMEHLKL